VRPRRRRDARDRGDDSVATERRAGFDARFGFDGTIGGHRDGGSHVDGRSREDASFEGDAGFQGDAGFRSDTVDRSADLRVGLGVIEPARASIVGAAYARAKDQWRERRPVPFSYRDGTREIPRPCREIGRRPSIKQTGAGSHLCIPVFP
jgi:hypothetical protein